MDNLKNFCYVPFKELIITGENTVAPCCIVYQEDWANIDDLQNFNYINDEYFVNLRKSFLQNQKNDICRKCWNTESSGFESFRNNRNKKYKGHDYNTSLQFIDLRLSNKCNLQCKMCSSIYSHKIAENELLVHDLGIAKTGPKAKEKLIFYSDYNNTNYMDKVFTIIEKNKNTIKGLRLAGGEPMIMPEVMKLIDWLVEEKMFHVELNILTNLTTLNTKLIKKLEKFDSCVVSGSIDGTKKYLEYQRFPVSWKVIQNNINKIQNTKIKFRLNPCWSQLNLLGLSDFIYTMQNYNIEFISIQQVLTPTYLDWRVVPMEYRKKLIQDLKKIQSSLPRNFDPGYINFINRIEYETKILNDTEKSQLREKIKIWNFNNKIKYDEICPWSEEILCD
jgi:organic radical activating enzyme